MKTHLPVGKLAPDGRRHKEAGNLHDVALGIRIGVTDKAHVDVEEDDRKNNRQYADEQLQKCKGLAWDLSAHLALDRQGAVLIEGVRAVGGDPLARPLQLAHVKVAHDVEAEHPEEGEEVLDGGRQEVVIVIVVLCQQFLREGERHVREGATKRHKQHVGDEHDRLPALDRKPRRQKRVPEDLKVQDGYDPLDVLGENEHREPHGVVVEAVGPRIHNAAMVSQGLGCVQGVRREKTSRDKRQRSSVVLLAVMRVVDEDQGKQVRQQPHQPPEAVELDAEPHQGERGEGELGGAHAGLEPHDDGEDELHHEDERVSEQQEHDQEEPELAGNPGTALVRVQGHAARGGRDVVADGPLEGHVHAAEMEELEANLSPAVGGHCQAERRGEDLEGLRQPLQADQHRQVAHRRRTLESDVEGVLEAAVVDVDLGLLGVRMYELALDPADERRRLAVLAATLHEKLRQLLLAIILVLRRGLVRVRPEVRCLDGNLVVRAQLLARESSHKLGGDLQAQRVRKLVGPRA
mmetsp:Transcript_42406/g.131886  ORF Transcript_42406/g.131886 Transcript_42406/m.131886 type:complete len:520 (-) Transcript_42406:760-2319(-)